MLTHKFNKLGDTSFRTKKQLLNYFIFFNLIKEKVSISNEEFIFWAKNNNIYDYHKKNKNFNRLDLVLKTFKNSKIIDKQNEKGLNFKKAKEFYENGDLQSFGFLILNNYKNKNIENKDLYPIKDFLCFLKENPNVDPNKSLICFLVYDGVESFNELYKKDDLIKDILNKNFDIDKISNQKIYLENELSRLFKFKKLGDKKKKWISKILNNWDNKLNFEDFQLCCKETEWNFMKFNKYKKKSIDFDFFIKISKKDFIYKMLYEKYFELLNKEYLDLILRWFYDLDLLSTSTKKNKKFINLEKLFNKDDKWGIKKYKKSHFYPYPFNREKTKILLEKMDKEIIIPKEIKYPITTATWAEYIVNLCFAYKYNIEPKDFNKFSNTIVSKDLFPISHATRGKADFSFSNNQIIHIVETTIHKTDNAIIDNEITRICRHLEKEFNNKNYSQLKLSLISFLNKQSYNKAKNISLGYFHSSIMKEKINFEYLTFLDLSNLL